MNTYNLHVVYNVRNLHKHRAHSNQCSKNHGCLAYVGFQFMRTLAS